VTVLVTGGAGYIGSHTAKALARAGYQVVVFDNLLHGHRWAVKWGPLEEGDLNDGASLDRVFQSYPIDAVLHFAASIAVGESMNDPLGYFRNNTGGSLELLRAMDRHGTGRIVFSSTAAVYGTPERTPIPEGAAQRPENPYGESKLMIERMLAWMGARKGWQWASLRYFNAAGADPDGELGEDHDPETHLIPLVLDAVAGARGPVKVFGSDYPTPDGTCIRDYIHVSDLADAHVAALRRLERGQGSGTWNLGTGQGHSVREVLEMAQRISGKPVPSAASPRRPGDAPVLVADPARALQDLGWAPRRSSLEEIIRTAWNWRTRFKPA
jgi:UDP-glucose-4-epimerase GalE